MGLKKNKTNYKIKNKLENYLMTDGKKNISENLLFRCILLIQQEHPKEFKSILFFSFSNNLPVLHIRTLIKKKKKKFFNYIPYFLEDHSLKILMSIKLLIKTVKSSSNKKKTFKSLKKIFVSLASKNLNDFKNFKEEIHEMVYIKKKYSHYRWF